MKVDFEIIQYQQKFHQSVIDLITSIQQQEFDIAITYKDQPDLHDIQKYYNKFWIALNSENQVIGTIGMMILDNFAIIRKMFVDKNYRGLGISQKLLNEFEIECLNNKINKIFLGTTESFKAAHRFYEKNKYQQIAAKNLPQSFPVMKVDKKFYFKNLNNF